MNKKNLSLGFLLLGMLLLSLGLFAVTDLDWRNNLLFLGVVCGVTGMVLKIASMLKSK